MEVTATPRNGGIVIAPGGRIDHETADDFTASLQPHLAACRAGNPTCVLDMAAVDYISSVGLRALMVAAKQVREQSGRLVIACLTPVVREVFEISRFDAVFEVYDSVEAAIASGGPHG